MTEAFPYTIANGYTKGNQSAILVNSESQTDNKGLLSDQKVADTELVGFGKFSQAPSLPHHHTSLKCPFCTDCIKNWSFVIEVIDSSKRKPFLPEPALEKPPAALQNKSRSLGQIF